MNSVVTITHFISTYITASGVDILEVFADRVARYRGPRKILISDRDVHFSSKLHKMSSDRFKVKKGLSSSWHPQSDGHKKRIHRTLDQVWKCSIQSNKDQWEQLLPAKDHVK